MRSVFNLIYAMALLSFSMSTYAADNGECGTPEAMTAKLKAEGQRSYATADRVKWINKENVFNGMIFTLNPERTIGYVLESDKPSDEKASKICVRNRLTDIRVYDARKPGLDPASLLKASDADGQRRCAEIIKSGALNAGTCEPFNASMRRGEAIGDRILMQGFNVDRQRDGSYKRVGTLTTVTANVTGSFRTDPNQPWKGVIGGVFFTSLPDGATITNMVLAFAEYTPYGLSLLGGTQK